MRGREREKETTFIKEWNEIIEYKISEANLRSPDFNFFYNALESLLRSLNVDIEALKDGVPAYDFERMYQIKFCAYVNSLYQLYDPSFNFYFLDLVYPTGKKCIHVLKMMLNYLKYYEMVKQEVRNEAMLILNDYDAALEEKNKLDMHHESIKQRSNTINKKLDEYEKKLPALKEKVAKLAEEEEQLDKTCLKKVEEAKGFDALILNLELKESELKEQVVSEVEFEDVAKSLAMFQKEVTELEKTQEETAAANLILLSKMDEISNGLNEINSLLDSIKLSDYESLITAETKLMNELNKIAGQEQKLKELSAQDEELMKKVQAKGMELHEKQKELVKIKEDYRKRIHELNRENVQLNEMIERLKAEYAKLEQELRNLRAEQELLVGNVRIVLTGISSTFQ